MSARKVIVAVALTVTISILLGCSGLFLVVGRLNGATKRVRRDLSCLYRRSVKPDSDGN
jgi:hypothetical protein